MPLTVVALVRTSWAIGATVGLSPQFIESRGVAERLADAGTAVFALAAAVGMLALVLRRPAGSPTWIPVALAWVGGGAVFGSGLYSMVLVLAAAAGTGVATTQTGLVPFVDLVQVILGTVIAAAGAFVLADLNTPSIAASRAEGA